LKVRNGSKVGAAVLALALALSACSGPVSPGGASGGNAGGKTKIVYWSMFSTGEPLQQLLQSATDRFMKENPDIQVEINWAGRDVLTKLQGAINAGQQVDIVDHSNDRVRSAVVLNHLALQLDPYLQQPAYGATTGKWLDSFNPGSVQAFAEKDGVYEIPRDVYVSGIWYNTTMLSQAGLKPPVTGMTWDQFLQMLDTLKKNNPGVSPLGADGSIDFYNNWWFSYLAIRLAGLDAFKKAAYDKTGAAWNQPVFLKAAQMVRDLQDRGYFQKGFEGSVYPAAQAQWVNGKTGMMLMGAWLPKEVESQAPKNFKMDMFAFPNVNGGQGNNLVEYWANVYSVLKSSKHPDAAVKWLKFMTSPNGAGGDLAKAGFPTALKDAPVPPTHVSQAQVLQQYKVMGQRGGLNDEIPHYMTEVYNRCDDRFFQLQSSPTEFISCLSTGTAKFWSANPAPSQS
jgi:ABC-type glycerol-3-phosphate transport system substrate-binding protein